jgi:hypothetical protein
VSVRHIVQQEAGSFVRSQEFADAIPVHVLLKYYSQYGVITNIAGTTLYTLHFFFLSFF